MPHILSDDLEPWRKNQPEVNRAVSENGHTLRGGNTIEDVELALRTLALNGGNYSQTHRVLEEQHSLSVHPQTLKKWASTSFPNLYADILHELKDDIGQRLGAKLSEAASKAVEVQDKILTRLDENVHELKPGELAASARNIAQTASLDIEKANLLRGDATSRISHMTPEEIVEELREMEIALPEDAVEVIDEEK